MRKRIASLMAAILNVAPIYTPMPELRLMDFAPEPETVGRFAAGGKRKPNPGRNKIIPCPFKRAGRA